MGGVEYIGWSEGTGVGWGEGTGVGWGGGTGVGWGGGTGVGWSEGTGVGWGEGSGVFWNMSKFIHEHTYTERDDTYRDIHNNLHLHILSSESHHKQDTEYDKHHYNN